MKKVYISATYNDLKEHRTAVAHALRKMGYEVRCMEDYVATDERTDARCAQDVSTCDFYVGIIAQRYGWTPPGRDRSITELEYMQARSNPHKTRCLIFLLDEEAEWPLQWIDALHDQNSAAKLRAFRTELEVNSNGRFRTLENLVQDVMASVYMEDLKTWKVALRQEFEKILDECKATPVGAPDLGNDAKASLDYKLFIGSSAAPIIGDVLATAIHNANRSRLVGIDLLREGGWWSTRLHLLAGLLADYTGVEKIVFSANGKCLGTCGPAQVRGALAESKPSVEKAFAESLLDRRELDPALDIPQILERFSANLNAMGGEMSLRQKNPPDLIQVTPNIVQNFPGFNPELVQCQPNQDGMELLPVIVGKPYPYVPLEFATGESVVIDRVRLASRIAQLAIERI
jgi:Domain of unknown function (DUF4062)